MTARVVEALAAASACLFSSAFENKRRYNVFVLFESVKICVNLWLKHAR